jgi:hypothetical protein
MGVGVGCGVAVDGNRMGVGVGCGVAVDGNRMGAGVGCGVAVGAGVGVFGKVTGVAVAMMGAGVTVGTSAMAVATRASTICWTSASDGPAAAQPAVPAEITITPTAQKTRINCMQTLGILVTRLII